MRPGERAQALVHREQVGERLARVLEVRQGVDDRHAAAAAPAPPGAPARRSAARSRRRSGRAPGPCPRSSRRGPAAARSTDSTTACAARWATPDLERDPRPRGRLLEDQRDRPARRGARVGVGSAFTSAARSSRSASSSGSGRRRRGSRASTARSLSARRRRKSASSRPGVRRPRVGGSAGPELRAEVTPQPLDDRRDDGLALLAGQRPVGRAELDREGQALRARRRAAVPRRRRTARTAEQVAAPPPRAPPARRRPATSLGDDERQVAADRREPRHVAAATSRAAGAPSSAVELQLARRDPPVELERLGHARVQLADDADRARRRSARRPTGRGGTGARRASPSDHVPTPQLAIRASSTPVASSASNGRGVGVPRLGRGPGERERDLAGVPRTGSPSAEHRADLEERDRAHAAGPVARDRVQQARDEARAQERLVGLQRVRDADRVSASPVSARSVVATRTRASRVSCSPARSRVSRPARERVGRRQPPAWRTVGSVDPMRS